MSYIDAFTVRDKVHVWERIGNERMERIYDAPYYFYVPKGSLPRHEGELAVGLKGEQLVKVEFDSMYDMMNAIKSFKAKNITLYESDITPDIKILSEHYHGVPEPKLNISVFDIEVDVDIKMGWLPLTTYQAPLNAITIHHMWNNSTVSFVVPPPNWNDEFDESLLELSDVAICANERELLICTIDAIKDSDIISGWNSTSFDLPYIANRVERVLGLKYYNKLCFPNCPSPNARSFENAYGTTTNTIDLYGRQHLDYMELFKKYEASERPSYKLQQIADEFLPDLPKLKYDGTLTDLYHNDFNYFIRYNIRDTEILRGLEEKLGYISLANTMVHATGVKFSQVLGTIKPAETAILNYCHHDLNVKVPTWTEKPDATIKGAYVLYPQIGMHNWTSNVDISSLYPSTIRTLNISPETIVGQFAGRDTDWDKMFHFSNIMNSSNINDSVLTFQYEDGKCEQHTASEWRQILIENKWSVSAYGVVFDQNIQGVIPTILSVWYSQRKEFQKLKKQTQEKLDLTDKNSSEYNELSVLVDYYDKQQYVRKIQLNSLYGALTNVYFKFYDPRMGASTTYSGRQILMHQIRKIGELIDGNYHFTPPMDANEAELYGFPSPSIVYGDTDSCYFATHQDNTEDAVKFADGIADKVNESFPHFVREAFMCSDGFDKLITCGREVVADSSIFVEKKRYIMHLTEIEGHLVDKIKIMGLDFKRTTLPKEISTRLVEIIRTILVPDPNWKQFDRDVLEYKNELKQINNVFKLGLPKGINTLSKYVSDLEANPKANVPGHVMASILWNKLLVDNQDYASARIQEGMKVKIFYMKSNIGRAKAIAIPGDLIELPQWFNEQVLNNIDFDMQLKKLVDAPLNNTLKAVKRKSATEQSVLFDDIFEF